MLDADGRLRLFGHPLHPILTDLPIGLWSVAFIWDLLALWRGDFWWEVSFWTLLISLIVAVPTALAGLIDSRALPPGTPASSTASTHLLLMASAITCFLISLLLRGGVDPLDGLRAVGAFAVLILGLAVMTVGAWFGGQLVYRFASGVEASGARAPQSADD